jgi:uncharacterized RDD family membrane protein YckC
MNPTLKRLLFPFAKREPTPRDRFAGYQARIFATTIDLSCLFFLLYEPFSWLSRIIYGDLAPSEVMAQGANISWQQAVDLYSTPKIATLATINFLIQICVIAILYSSCQLGFGTTPGRYLIGIKLVDANTEQDPSLFQFIRRFFGYFISLPPLMLGYMWIIWDAKRQTWHDKVAGTVMLDMRPEGWYWAQVKRLYHKIRGS